MLVAKLPGYAKAALLTLVSVSFYYFYATNKFYRHSDSVFYNPARAFERSYSLHRETEAIAYRNEAFFSYSTDRTDIQPIWKVGASPTICAVIVTVARESGQKAHPLEVRVLQTSPCYHSGLPFTTALHHECTRWSYTIRTRRS